MITETTRTENVWKPSKNTPYSFSNAYVAKSWWGNDSYAAFDLREIRILDRELNDTDLIATRNAMKSAYGMM